jgi:hypothetical protein
MELCDLPLAKLKHGVVRHFFTADEDALLCRVMQDLPFTRWIDIASQLPGRSARQCRDRWMNYLSPANKNEAWTTAEDDLLLEKVNELGSRWSLISKYFNGRSENNVKNRWYTHLRPKPAPGTVVDESPPVNGKRFWFPSITSLSPDLPLTPVLSPDEFFQAMNRA